MKEEVEMTLEHTIGGWKVKHFPHTYTAPELMLLKKDVLVEMLLQMNVQGRALDDVVTTQDETIKALRSLSDVADENATDYIQRIGNLHEAASALLHLIAGATIGDMIEVGDD